MPTCLIVDDSHIVRRVARRIVETLGFDCVEAENGKQALEHCAQTMPDAILLDWNMPVMDGMECLKQFKEMPNTAQTKIIFCTVENSADRIRQAVDAGADEYIMKPFDFDIVASKFALTGLTESR